MDDKKDILNRKVQGYLKPKNHVLFDGFVKTNQVSESAAINMIVKDFFSRTSDRERAEYINRAKGSKSY